jgi:hypothetical protein
MSMDDGASVKILLVGPSVAEKLAAAPENRR